MPTLWLLYPDVRPSALGGRADPWLVGPIPGDDDLYLTNRSASAKFGVQITFLKVDVSPVVIAKIAAGKWVEMSFLRIWHPDGAMLIEWHQQEDLSHEPLTATETIPSKI